MIDTHDYPVTVRWNHGKQGVATSTDRLPEIEVATPPEFGGPPHLWSPEHLFVAAAASCFMTTYLAIAAASHLEIESIEVPATGTLVRDEDRRYSIAQIELRPRIGLTDESHRDKAARLVAKSDAACLITRSMRSEVSVEPTFEVVSEPTFVG